MTEKSSRKRDERSEIGEAYGKAIVGQVQKNKETKAGCVILRNWINESSVRILSKRECNVRTVDRGQEAGLQLMRAGILSRLNIAM